MNAPKNSIFFILTRIKLQHFLTLDAQAFSRQYRMRRAMRLARAIAKMPKLMKIVREEAPSSGSDPG